MKLPQFIYGHRFLVLASHVTPPLFLKWRASAFGDTQVLDNQQLNSWLASRLTKACVESYCLDGHCPPGQLTHAPPDSFNLMELGLSSPSRRWCVTPAFRGTPVLIIGLRCEMVG